MVGNLPRRAAVAALALICAGFLSTCDFLTGDIFPSWFSYAAASVDLRSVMKAQGLGDLADVVAVEYTPFDDGSADYSAVLVFAAGNSTKRLIFLDPDTLAYRDSLYHADLNGSVAAAASDFRCGDTLVDPVDHAAAPAPSTWSNSAVRIFRSALGGMNYVVRPNSSQQALFEEDTPTWSTTNSVTKNFDSVNNMYNFHDAEYVNGYSVLASLQYSSYGFATSFSSAAGFYGATYSYVFDDPTAQQTGPFPVDENWAWLTEGGPVAFVRGNGNTNRLVRYRWGTGGFTTTWLDWENYQEAEAIDSVPFDDNGYVRILSFDASGRWWFVYDRLSGILYKLRTWWK